jgi:hypothetical protein
VRRDCLGRAINHNGKLPMRPLSDALLNHSVSSIQCILLYLAKNRPHPFYVCFCRSHAGDFV